MKTWRMVYCSLGQVEGYLKDGWEPFAVTIERETIVEARNYKQTIWLKKVEQK